MFKNEKLSRFQSSIPPFPGWKRCIHNMSRLVTEEDIRALLGNEELYTRDTSDGTVNIIHKYGLLELHAIVGEKEIEVWYDQEKGAYPSEYLDALLKTRF